MLLFRVLGCSYCVCLVGDMTGEGAREVRKPKRPGCERGRRVVCDNVESIGRSVDCRKISGSSALPQIGGLQSHRYTQPKKVRKWLPKVLLGKEAGIGSLVVMVGWWYKTRRS